ncbi:MAG: methylmalonyl Co-A mutase-associated GTPase MeaB [Thermotogaceae bacterium]|nr:methylmalonyl Co-A mutase-associated GTPase MeaB [Thermotogaceae bacterium]
MEKDMKTLSRLITQMENDPLSARKITKGLDKKEATVIGITGPAGAGKSTLVNTMIKEYRKSGYKVGVIAVDPSSPFSGGAFLGDRIRMKQHFTDENVFIRSMASRGALGGLNDSIFDVVELMKGFDFDVIIVETVGAGQTEIDIVYVAQTVLLVLSPGGGDEIQMLKAGLVEIADVFVINKSDMPGADTLELSIRAMLEISERKDWIPPIVRTVATEGTGIRELVDKIQEHERYLVESGKIRERQKRRVKKHAEHILRNRIRKVLNESEGDSVDELLNMTMRTICKDWK